MNGKLHLPFIRVQSGGFLPNDEQAGTFQCRCFALGDIIVTVRLVLSVLLAVMTLVSPATAQDRVTLGYGRLFSNDAIGDGNDRSRTGSYAVSRLRGLRWDGSLPTALGEILEFRLRADTITPANLEKPAADDRRYVGAITLGMHTQFDLDGYEVALGGDLVFIGPQTGIGDFQSFVHDALGLGEVNAVDMQIGNAVRPTVSAEIARRFSLGGQVEIRPFVEARVGDEIYVRAGGDLVLAGGFGRGDLMLRDITTGHRFRGIAGEGTRGMSVVLGGDIAQVFDSAYLPDGGAVTQSDTRNRLRAGMHWQGKQSSVFYGMTYLGPEFEEQDEGQMLGSVTVSLRF